MNNILRAEMIRAGIISPSNNTLEEGKVPARSKAALAESRAMAIAIRKKELHKAPTIAVKN